MIYGGICLDFYKEIPSGYKKILKIGKNTVIKSGTILAGDGFHFTRDENGVLNFTEHKKKLIIGDNVWIGSNCTIDRGRVRNTVVNGGSKIDNGVHISHNCVIGHDCIIGTGARILGSVTVGNRAEIWTNAIIHQGVTIGDGAVVGANTYVRHNIPDNMCVYNNNRTGKIEMKPKSETKKYDRGGSKKCLNGKCHDSTW